MDCKITRAVEEALSELTERPVVGLTPETRFDRDFDLDSYMFVQFLLLLEDKIADLHFDPEAIGQAEFNVLSSLVDYIAERTGQPMVSEHA
ncbi:hypothetical protein TSH100_15170 [Azospirillum sp. TSH100]|uniref:acyl carrier protein n=1 Tax=unclassified Azospirillum TaxID=2630922 RepID=UPI000D605F21|nr:phosphopantetheine-binding protein [Azospirillum sp. TSH100]PWC85494.1 hypothetical protein TSH100_15170 [Azospirillum sp. TSH100]